MRKLLIKGAFLLLIYTLIFSTCAKEREDDKSRLPEKQEAPML